MGITREGRKEERRKGGEWRKTCNSTIKKIVDLCVSSVLENFSEFHLILFSPSCCANFCPNLVFIPCMGVLSAVLFSVVSEVPGAKLCGNLSFVFHSEASDLLSLSIQQGSICGLTQSSV